MFVSTAGVHHRDQVIRTAYRHFGVGWHGLQKGHRRVGAVRGAAFHFDALEGHAARCRIVVVAFAFGVARALFLAMVVAISFLVFTLCLFAVIVAMVLLWHARPCSPSRGRALRLRCACAPVLPYARALPHARARALPHLPSL